MIESLNNYAGLFSLLAVLSAIVVPIVIYKKERKAEKLSMKDELEAGRTPANLMLYKGESGKK